MTARMACVGLALALMACGSAGDNANAGGDGGAPFVAFASNFASFRSWPSHTTDQTLASGSTHVAGPRTVFINQPPAATATEFPIGTIIVKETMADGKIFARVKRGGGYNATGAVNWEWFELLDGGTAGVSIIWRGVGPPAGEKYGGDANGGCNGCHGGAGNNDYVLSPWLSLAGGDIDASVDAGAINDASND